MRLLDDRMPATNPEAEAAAVYDRRARLLSEQNRLPPVASLTYGPHPKQRIELYRPTGLRGGGALPVLVFLHGGAWIAGGMEWLRFMAEAATQQPAILAAVSYRLAPQDKWPAQLDDAAAAVRLVQAEVHRHGGDPERMVVAGHSAGGHLAAMTVLACHIDPVRACMPVSGPMDLRYDRIPSDIGKGRVYRYLFQTPEDDEGASPICAIEGNTTPFHFVWGENDFDRIADSCFRMDAAMRNAGQVVESHVIPEAGHFDTHLVLNNTRNDWYRAFRSFVG
ncbi:MAG: alpha/beta hydrolase [Pigmentiphaga sp.]